MLTSAIAKLLPLVFLADCFESIPEDLGQEMATSNTLRAADNCVWYFEGRKDSTDDGRFTGR